jgi:hypothetical protein
MGTSFSKRTGCGFEATGTSAAGPPSFSGTSPGGGTVAICVSFSERPFYSTKIRMARRFDSEPPLTKKNDALRRLISRGKDALHGDNESQAEIRRHVVVWQVTAGH